MKNVENKQLKYEKALEYEIFTKEGYGFAKNKIQDAECIFDIWWHVWYFSQWCRMLNHDTKIYYFEPVREFYNRAQSVLWNDENIILNNMGIGSKFENSTILFNEEKTMQSSKYSSFLNKNGKEINVGFITLKDYLRDNNIDKIDVLKMDIEWMEFEVLSSRWYFERQKIDNLIAEIHILNGEMKSEWDQLFEKMKNIFWSVEIICSWYCEDIFLVWACREAWLW